jgi:hypothetical protein
MVLLAMVRAFPASERLMALDWQHPDHSFRPHVFAEAGEWNWPIDVFPDGEYHVFLTEDMSEGTFGHPWEETLCVFGPHLLPEVLPLLSGWLPVMLSHPWFG